MGRAAENEDELLRAQELREADAAELEYYAAAAGKVSWLDLQKCHIIY